MNISTIGPVANIPPIVGGKSSWYDFNGNGTNDYQTPYTLSGHQCLVFFLGGVPYLDPNSNQWGMTGFYRNPSNPFTPSSFASTSTSRTTPLFEFRAPGC